MYSIAAIFAAGIFVSTWDKELNVRSMIRDAAVCVFCIACAKWLEWEIEEEDDDGDGDSETTDDSPGDGDALEHPGRGELKEKKKEHIGAHGDN